jgi:Leucine-rich repeat (LRR) protein
MSEWLEGLSEDWPSQPPSLNASAAASRIVSTASKPARSTRSSAAGGTSHARLKPHAANHTAPRRSSVLVERSRSDENRLNGTGPRGNNNSTKARQAAPDSTPASADVFDTVDKKAVTPSPAKARGLSGGDTPEWKRRLMGDEGHGQQTELFGPSGIESLFQKPPPQSQSPNKSGRLSFLKHLESSLPSSPPWPAKSAEKQLDVLESVGEIVEDGQDEGLSAEWSPQGEDREPATPKRDYEDLDAGSSAPSTPTNIPKQVQRPTPRKQSMPRVISRESNSDSFSAVFISKHNTADGGIAYAPIDMSRTELAEQLARLGMSNASQEMAPQPRVQPSAQDPFHAPSDDLPEDLPTGTPEMMNLGEFVTVKRGGYSDDGSFRRRPLSPSPLRASGATSLFASQGGSLKPSIRGRRTSTPFRKPSVGSRPPTANAPLLKPSVESKQNERNVSTGQFGAGDMDDYEFSEISVSHDASMSRDSMPSQSPSLDVIPPGSKDPVKFRFEQDVSDHGAKRKHRPGLSVTSAISVQKRNSARRNQPNPAALEYVDNTVEKNAEGKRPRTSPSKHPTPKRRRTLMTNDMANDEEEPKNLRSVEETHHRVQCAIGRKRKDSRYGSFMSRAGPDVLSQRQILRPRNPTPSQRRNELHRNGLMASPELQAVQQVLSASDAQARAFAADAAAADPPGDSRKRSVTTKDFLDEAMKLMSFIRNNPRPGSEFGNVQEVPDEEEFEDESELLGSPSQLSLSRPPSREGEYPRWRSRETEVRRPSVIRHLEKFKEPENEDFMTASLASRIDVIESQPPGIQIHGRPAHMDEDHQRTTSGPATKASHESTDSLGRTTSSRRSETVATLAPDAVAHLIPEEVAGMSFDREKGVWVKRRTSRRDPSGPIEESVVPSSEDDPFGNIPDLTCDIEEETRRLFLAGDSTQRDQSSTEELLQRHREESTPPSHSVARAPEPLDLAEPDVDDSIVIHDSVAVPKPTFDELDSVEHEIQINEGRTSQPQRKITVSFPVSLSVPDRRPSTRVEHDVPMGPRPLPRPSSIDALLKPPQIVLPNGSTLPPVHEETELSLAHADPGPRHVNFSVSLSGTAPQPVDQHPLSSPCRGDVTFLLSELSEFTIHQPDERELQTRTVSRRSKASDPAVEDRYAWGNHLLVKALQDAEGREPYWDELRAASLAGKGLTSLNLLDVMCRRLQRLDLSGNALDQLAGAPGSLRCLDVSDNRLSGLTWWGHLTNLQYLDVSGNRIGSLSGFGCLIHLRELVADRNCIASLDGLQEMDGLLKLSLRGNKIAGVVDFEGFQLPRLQSADLGCNRISEVNGLHGLHALTDLRLDRNEMRHFGGELPPTIAAVDLSFNSLESLALSTPVPNLRYLELDNNALEPSRLGLKGVKCLDILSLRRQSTTSQPWSFSDIATEISHLNLSFNPLLTLELASCGLTALPDNLAATAPNLQALNLNANAIRDIRPLLQCRSLTTLLVAGNRLARLRKTAAVLARLERLDTLDLRDNPFTLGFYAPTVHNDEPLAALPECAGKPPSRDAGPMVLQGRDDGDADARDLSSSPRRPGSAGTHAPQRPHDATLQLRGGKRHRRGPSAATAEEEDADADAAHRARLDPDTRLRRRVHEMLLLGSGARLRRLDGLPLGPARRAEVMRRDEVWERLVALGVLRRSEAGAGAKGVGEGKGG